MTTINRKENKKKKWHKTRDERRVMYIGINIQFYSTPQVIAAAAATAHKIFENDDDDDVDETTQQKYLIYFY